MDEMKGRGKRGLLRVVFGRTMFFLLFIALQLAFFFWIYVWLDNKYQAWVKTEKSSGQHQFQMKKKTKDLPIW